MRAAFFWRKELLLSHQALLVISCYQLLSNGELLCNSEQLSYDSLPSDSDLLSNKKLPLHGELLSNCE